METSCENMKLEQCFEDKNLVRIKPDAERAGYSAEQAEKFLAKAKGVMQLKYYDVSFLLAYNSIFQSIRALLFADGIKERSHFCAILYVAEKFKTDKDISLMFSNIQHYRELRHTVQYEGEDPAKEEIDIIIADAEKMVSFTKKFIKKNGKHRAENSSKKGSAKICAAAVLLFVAFTLTAISAYAFQATGNSYDLKYEIGDAGGNGSSANVDVTFLATQNAIGIFSQTLHNLWAGPQCIFNTPPNISITGTNVSALNDTTAIQISGLINDTDGSAVRLVVFKANNNQIACTGSNVTNGNSTCNFLGSSLGCGSEGGCTVRVYAQESEIGTCSGQDFSPSFLTVTYTYDITAPSISQMWPNTTNVGYAKNNTLVVINFTFTETNPKNFSASIFNSTATICNRDNTSLAGGTNVQVSTNCTTSATASDANYSVRVILFDIADQPISNTQTDAFQLDSTVPSAANVTVNETVTVSGTRYAKFAIPVNATASDNAGGSGIGYVEFYANSTLVGNDTTSPYGINWDTATIADGRYTLTIKAYDRAGNLLSVG